MANEVTVLETRKKAVMDYQDRIVKVLPACINNERFMSVALSMAVNSDLSKCDPNSIAKAVYQCAQLGLMPGPLGHVYIIPYGGVATVIPGYKGLIELARRSKRFGPVSVDLVFRGEEFVYWNDERGRHFKHVPDFKIRYADNATLLCGYCIAYIDDYPQPEIMAAEDIWAIQTKALDKAGTRNTPWKTDVDEMQKKTILRRASKMWPLTTELAEALELSAKAEGGEPTTSVNKDSVDAEFKVVEDELPPEEKE